MSGDQGDTRLSVIIPCYNEAKNLERGVLDEVASYLAGWPYSWQVVIANDESTDASRRLLDQFVRIHPRFTLVDIPHGGKPAAIWAGIQAATGDLLLLTDMDQSTPIGELDRLLPWAEQGYEVVIGSRKSTREGTSLLRKAGSYVFLTLRRRFLLREILDTQCGFKLVRRDVALELFPRLEFLRKAERPAGWNVTAFDVEFLYLAARHGYRIREVEVRWSNRDVSDTKAETGEMARYLHESLQMAREVIRVKRNELRGLYDQG
jgi:glycosyltransferase involved in cell wall biosynthesis